MGIRVATLALCLAFGGMAGGYADAAPTSSKKAHSARVAAPAKTTAITAKRHATTKTSRHRTRVASGNWGGGLSCVPYARMVTGMNVSGNGGQWWYNAAGVYDRGSRPQPGSVLAFRSSGGMSRGHVAVVSRVVAPRHVQIDHSNWGGPGIRRGTVMRDVNVIDVSEANDWSAVRVQVGHDASAFGRTYPTFGFIHNRPANSIMRADAGGRVLTEIAEAPAARR